MLLSVGFPWKGSIMNECFLFSIGCSWLHIFGNRIVIANVIWHQKQVRLFMQEHTGGPGGGRQIGWFIIHIVLPLSDGTQDWAVHLYCNVIILVRINAFVLQTLKSGNENKQHAKTSISTTGVITMGSSASFSFFSVIFYIFLP